MDAVECRPLADLREEYWMIQKLGCGGFGKGTSLWSLALQTALMASPGVICVDRLLTSA